MTTSEKVMFGFIAAFMSSALWPNLPTISLILAAFVIFILTLYFRLSALIFGTIVGFFWASLCAYYYLHLSIPPKYLNKNVVVEGKISSLVVPIKNQDISKAAKINLRQQTEVRQSNNIDKTSSIKFNFILHKIGKNRVYHKPKIRITWFGAPQDIKQGQQWRFYVKLKKPVSLANPDTYNYQQWLVSKNLSALAYVLESPSIARLDTSISFRQKLVDKLLDKQMSNKKWMLALSYGERALFERTDWELLQRTGTAHLFAISGMHLGIVFGFSLMIIKLASHAYLAIKGKLRVTKDFRLVKYSLALLICFFYAMLAGYQIPVMRALCALLLWIGLICTSRHWRHYSLLLSLLCLIVVLYPFSILSLSFWFSFGAVIFILFFLWRYPYPKKSNYWCKFMHLIKLQTFMSILSIPIVLLNFGVVSSSAIVANIIMIPIVTFILVPSSLIVSLLSIMQIEYALIYSIMDFILGVSFDLLRAIDSADLALQHKLKNHLVGGELVNTFSFSKNIYPYLLSPMLYSIILLAFLPPWFGKSRLLIGLLFLQIFNITWSWNSTQQKRNDWNLHVFDVGQGSAMVIEANQEYMLYDTGNANEKFSMASSVLLPFFHARHIEHLTIFAISHFDSDHAGGQRVIEDNFSIDKFLSPQNNCNTQALPYLAFAHLKVEVLWPLEKREGHDNNDSCVIKISDEYFSVLLTGDIEAQAEAHIVSLYKESSVLNADVLLAPHHGSKTSSTQAFVDAVSPKIVIFTSGYNNRWGFPAKQVIARYSNIIEGSQQSTQFVTGNDGRIKVSFAKQEMSVSRYRHDEYKRWFFKAQ